jgi:Fic family protein
VKEGLLDIPMLYLSQHIVRHKVDYYRLLQTVREEDTWEDWVHYLLDAVEQTAGQTIHTVLAIKTALFDYKQRIRAGYKFYSQDLINNLFMHPYTKIDYVQRDLGVSRITATKYLDALTEGGFVKKHRIGRGNYYVNLALNSVLADHG